MLSVFAGHKGLYITGGGREVIPIVQSLMPRSFARQCTEAVARLIKNCYEKQLKKSKASSKKLTSFTFGSQGCYVAFFAPPMLGSVGTEDFSALRRLCCSEGFLTLG